MDQSKDDALFLKRINELASKAYMRGICVYSNFCGLHESHLFFQTICELPNVRYQLFGGYEEAERRVVCFCEDDSFHNIQFPIVCVHITPASWKSSATRKYTEHLTHRDYLGSILGLGVERSKIGDILLKGPEAYVFLKEEIRDFLMDSLSQVKHTRVVCEEVSWRNDKIAPNLEQKNAYVPSLRLDAVLAGGFSGSRSQLSQLIRAQKVYINGRLASSNSEALKEGDIVSVRGTGRFRLSSVDGQTKKGRYRITIEKYC